MKQLAQLPPDMPTRSLVLILPFLGIDNNSHYDRTGAVPRLS